MQYDFPAHFAAVQRAVDLIDAEGISRHPDVDAAIAVFAALTADAEDITRPLPRLIDLDPGAAVLTVRNRGIAQSAQLHRGDSFADASLQLARETIDVVAADSDRIISELRPAFSEAAEGVAAAKASGIHPDTTADRIVDNDAAIAAWRPLDQHLATLERIATVRLALTDVFGVGPTETMPRGGYAHEAYRPTVAAFVTEVGDLTALSAAQHSFGYPRQRVTNRRWLGLGTLHLNTGHEADQVVAAAERASRPSPKAAA